MKYIYLFLIFITKLINTSKNDTYCVDTVPENAIDIFNGTCSFYVDFPNQCGYHDNLNFYAKSMCCACGGGKVI